MLHDCLLGLCYASPIAYVCGAAVFALVPMWPQSWKQVMDFWTMRILVCVLWPIFGIVLLVRKLVTR